jgi:hypothetical protein
MSRAGGQPGPRANRRAGRVVPERPVPPPPRPGRGRGAGIYGTIITAAVLADAGSDTGTPSLAITVFVTLLIYWLAEQYADLLGEHIHAGRLPTLARVRVSLTASWPLVTASYIPVAALLAAWLLGAPQETAAGIALGVASALLIVHGWSAARAADLRGMRLIAVTLLAAVLGLALVALKIGLQH